MKFVGGDESCAATSNVSRRRFGLLTAGIAVAAALPGRGAAKAKHPTASRNAELYRQLIERGFNKGDLSVADEICAQHIDEHQYLMPRDRPGPESMRSDIELTRKTVKQLLITIEDIAESGDKIWVRTHVTGIEAATGRPVAFDVIDICRFKNGKIVEHWGIPDRFAMLHQAGLLPSALM